MTNETNQLPAEVREAVYAASRTINERLGTTHYINVADVICTALAPLWPKPAQPSADVQRIAEEVFDYVDAQGVMINRELHCGRIAAILEREFAEKDALAERYRLCTLKQDAEIARLKKALDKP